MNQEELDSIKIYTIQDIEKPPDEAFLSAELIEAGLAGLADRLPPDVISELERDLKKVKVTENQFNEIIDTVIAEYEGSNPVNEFEKIHRKLNELDNYVAYFQQYLENEFQKPGQDKNINRNIELSRKVAGDESDIISISILLKWVEFLLSKSGEEYIEEVVRTYVQLGWIDEEQGEKMILLAGCLEVPQSGAVKRSKLTARDHIQSLIFIERLKAIELVEFDLLKSGYVEENGPEAKQRV